MGFQTLCWQEVGQDDQGGDEWAGQDDVDDVEKGLPLDDQVEGDLLVLQVFGGVPGIDHLPGWPMDNGPLAIFYVVKDAVRWRNCLLWKWCWDELYLWKPRGLCPPTL